MAGKAAYPRLVFNIEYVLKELDGTGYPLQDYEMIDLSGELRLSKQSDTVGTFAWIGQRHQHKSGTRPQKSHINLYCDLDPRRIETIEQHRDGQEPLFWIELWPTLAGGESFVNIQTRPARITIPRDKWIQILDGIGYGDFEIVEITRGELDKELYSNSISHLKEARNSSNHGNYGACLVSCRKAIEAMVKAMPKGKGNREKAFKEALIAKLGEDRGTRLNEVVRNVRGWESVAAHDQDEPSRHTRAEAQFILNSTINLLYLIGGLSEIENTTSVMKN